MSGRSTVFVAIGVLVALVVAGTLLPLPDPVAIRTWFAGAGVLGPVAFFLAYLTLTVPPIPRTVFTVSAGLLFGEGLGLVLAMTATTVSSVLAFTLARRVGGRWLRPYLERSVVRAVDERLSAGGMLGVASLRLVPMVPFAPLNYCCGLSGIALRPYLVGTVLGCLPGTTAVVLLGDALTGTTPPALLACYGGLALLGGVGLVLAMRRSRQRSDLAQAPMA